jgi:hypothetical protein
MRANEEPHDRVVILLDTDGSVRVVDSHRPQWQVRMQTLELQTWVLRIRLESSIGGSRPGLYLARQLCKIAPERRMKS